MVSDDRAKIRLSKFGTQCDIPIYLYTFNPLFLSPSKKQQKPKWFQNLIKSTLFAQNGSLFYSVCSQDVLARYPEAIRERKTRSMHCYYILTDKLPQPLQRSLNILNQGLLTNPYSVSRKQVDFQN